MTVYVGFDAEEIRTGEATRTARLKWVIVVDRGLPAGRIANAVACVAAATQRGVGGMLGPGGLDGDGAHHPGLPWAGCSILAADAADLPRIRAKAARREDMFLADMPAAAQETRVYDDYLTRLLELSSTDIDYAAISIVGPRNGVDRVVGRLSLMP